MIVKCPVCGAEHDVTPGSLFRCKCGAKFSADDTGKITLGGAVPAPPPREENDPLEKTIAPRRHEEHDPAADVTMPGRRSRKPDGRFDPGDLIMGRYKVLAELGQGGMGVVYKCFDETAGIEVALKALPPELSHNSLEMEDIRENFQLVAKLVHQNIAISKNLERDNSNGNYYLIMECVEGEDLRRWIKRKRREGGLTLADVLPVIRQVAAALDYAHKEGVIHRDIKPGNIMIDQAGDVKVLDFGLAAQIHTSMTRVSMAYHGTSGTGPYMAPEQWRGRAQGAAADQYALAVMTYEMLAGHLPFESTDVAVLQQAVLTQNAEAIPNIPKYAQSALDRAMSKEPAERFASCADFAAALGGQKIAADSHKGGKGIWFAVAAILLLALGAGGYGYSRYAEKQRLAEETRVSEEAAQKRQAEERRAEEKRRAAESAQKRQTEKLRAAEKRLAAESAQKRQTEERRAAEEVAAANRKAELERRQLKEENERLRAAVQLKSKEEESAKRRSEEESRRRAHEAERRQKQKSEANERFRKRDFAGALKLYREIENLSPEELFRKGISEMETGETQAAIRDLAAASRAGYHDPECKLGELYGKSGQWAEALEYYERVLKRDKTNISALSHAAIICLYGRNGRTDIPAGFQYLKRAAELGDPKSMYNLGCCFAHFRGVDFKEIPFSRDEAVRWLKKAHDAGVEVAAEKLRFLGE